MNRLILKHVNSTNFNSIFFTDECEFYEDNPSESWWSEHNLF